jgi:hypothetical protein
MYHACGNISIQNFGKKTESRDRDCLVDLDISGRIIIKWILEK